MPVDLETSGIGGGGNCHFANLVSGCVSYSFESLGTRVEMASTHNFKVQKQNRKKPWKASDYFGMPQGCVYLYLTKLSSLLLIGDLPVIFVPDTEKCESGSVLMKNGMVRACTQLRTCEAFCVHNFVLFTVEEMLFDTYCSCPRSNTVTCSLVHKLIGIVFLFPAPAPWSIDDAVNRGLLLS